MMRYFLATLCLLTAASAAQADSKVTVSVKTERYFDCAHTYQFLGLTMQQAGCAGCTHEEEESHKKAAQVYKDASTLSLDMARKLALGEGATEQQIKDINTKYVKINGDVFANDTLVLKSLSGLTQKAKSCAEAHIPR